MWLDSTPGAGSRFHVVTPFATRPALAAQHPDPDVSELRGMPALIVDDNATNRRILHDVLVHWGMQPTVAKDGVQALNLLKRAHDEGAPFPIVLLDHHMPGMSGLEVANEMHLSATLAATSIVVLSSGLEWDAIRASELGIAASLTKPVRRSVLLKAILTAVGQTRHAAKERQKAPQAVAPARRSARVLLAEDNPVNTRLVTVTLERHGFVVVTAVNGKEAVELAAAAPFDLVLMDMQMPEMDGFEATAVIRAAEAGTSRRIPIIALTARAMKGDREACLAAGADLYLSKPVRTQELLEMIDGILGPAVTASETAEPHAATPAFDTTELLDRVGGDRQLLAELVEMFSEESPKTVAVLRRSLTDQDAPSLERAAHKLRGALGAFGAEAASQTALSLETLGRAGDLSGADAQLKALEGELGQLAHELARFAHAEAI